MCTVLIQTSQMPASPVTVQLTTLKSALHGNTTSIQCTHSHTPTTAALHSLSTHMSTKHVLFAIPRTIRTRPSLGKKKKKNSSPNITLYIYYALTTVNFTAFQSPQKEIPHPLAINSSNLLYAQP